MSVSRRELALATLLSASVVLLRLLWHPHFLLDDETTFVNTVGRDWAHGAPGLWTRLQLITYQGSFLLDALLSSWGYRVVGDHLLAWFWVSIAYVIAFTGLGAVLCARTGGRWGLWLWAALVAGAPFLLKDGLIAIPGGHTSSIVWVLLALVFLQRALEGSERAAVLAGAAAGFAAWYTRSAVLVAAVVPFVLWMAARRQGLRALLGLVVLPILLTANGLALRFAGPWAGNDPPPELWSRMLWNVYELGDHERSLLGKALEVVGLRGSQNLFAQPTALPGERVAASWAAFGGFWAVALAAGVVAAGILAARRTRAPRGVALLDAVGLLGLLYVAAYVLSPLRIEPETLALQGAPLPTMVRYVTPSMLVGLVFLGLGCARMAACGGRRRWMAVALVAALAAPGVGLALADRSDRAGQIWAERVPYKYYRVFGAHRGLPPDLLAAWRPSDPAADRNRLEVLGTFQACSPSCVQQDRMEPARRLALSAAALGLQGAERATLARGMGLAFADHLWSSDEVAGADLLQLAIDAAALMREEDGAAWLEGFGEVAAEDPALLQVADVRSLCSLEVGDARPLCKVAGGSFAFSCDADVAWAETGVSARDRAEAAGWRMGRDLPPWRRGPCAERLDSTLRTAYGRGWERGAAVSWRTQPRGQR